MTDYSKMSDIEINNSVAKSIGGEILFDKYDAPYRLDPCAMSAYSGRDFDEVEFDPCNNPADAWPIIVGNAISIVCAPGISWLASSDAYFVDGVEWQIDGVENLNPLRAAMIVFLMMKEAGSV